MIAFILFSILIGTLILVLLHLERSANTGTTSKQIQEKLQKEKQKKRIDDMLLRWKEEADEMEKKKIARRIYLESKEDLTPEEWEFREEMRAIEIHDKEMEAINRGDIPYSTYVILFSEKLKRKDEEMRAKSEFPDMPSSMGLKLKEKNPSTKRWNLEMEVRARAPIGSIFEWMSGGVHGEPDHIVSYVLIRVNDTHRWHQLTITREKHESLEDVLAEYVMTLDRNVFHGNEPDIRIVPSVGLPTACVSWNPETQSWNIRQ
jgi:hypothetical protein